MSCRPLTWDWGLWGLVLSLIGLELLRAVGLTPLHQALVIVAFVVLGLPHGALDLTIYRRWGGRWSTPTFVAAYLAASAAVVASWTWAPLFTLLAFLVGSAWHLGESDFDRAGPLRHLLGLSRGLMIVGLPFVCHPHEVGSVLQAMGVQLDGFPESWRATAILLLGAQHALTLVRFGRRVGRELLVHEMAQGLVLAVTLVVLHPLLSFTLYFTLWHAVAHFIRVGLLKGEGEAKALAKKMAPWTAAAMALLTALLAAHQNFGSLPSAAGTAIVLVSGLTLPHTVVVSWARWRV